LSHGRAADEGRNGGLSTGPESLQCAGEFDWDFKGIAVLPESMATSPPVSRLEQEFEYM
jgi:hypothetical protein